MLVLVKDDVNLDAQKCMITAKQGLITNTYGLFLY
jgi:hypothetical protein